MNALFIQRNLKNKNNVNIAAKYSVHCGKENHFVYLYFN